MKPTESTGRSAGPIATLMRRCVRAGLVAVGRAYPLSVERDLMQRLDADVADTEALTARARAGEVLPKWPCTWCGTPTTLRLRDELACCPAKSCIDSLHDRRLAQVVAREPPTPRLA